MQAANGLPPNLLPSAKQTRRATCPFPVISRAILAGGRQGSPQRMRDPTPTRTGAECVERCYATRMAPSSLHLGRAVAACIPLARLSGPRGPSNRTAVLDSRRCSPARLHLHFFFVLGCGGSAGHPASATPPLQNECASAAALTWWAQNGGSERSNRKTYHSFRQFSHSCTQSKTLTTLELFAQQK